MRALNIIKTGLDLWLQRHYGRVAATCLIIGGITMLIDISLYIQCYLVLCLWLAVCVTFYYGYQVALLHSGVEELWDVPIRRFEEFRRIRFASFIVRRLLYQLQLAGQRLPKPKTAFDLMDPAIQQIFEQVQKDAYQAVQLFRRDANALLIQQSLEQESLFVVPEDEDEELMEAGFSKALVPIELIRQLLMPYGEA
nr:uncharacterized protein LOC108077556 [Drosophila kikkawai]